MKKLFLSLVSMFMLIFPTLVHAQTEELDNLKLLSQTNFVTHIENSTTFSAVNLQQFMNIGGDVIENLDNKESNLLTGLTGKSLNILSLISTTTACNIEVGDIFLLNEDSDEVMIMGNFTTLQAGLSQDALKSTCEVQKVTPYNGLMYIESVSENGVIAYSDEETMLNIKLQGCVGTAFKAGSSYPFFRKNIDTWGTGDMLYKLDHTACHINQITESSTSSNSTVTAATEAYWQPLLTAIDKGQREKIKEIAPKFNDFSTDHPNYIAVELLAMQGVIKGYEDDTFRPEANVTRAEFFKIYFKANDMNGTDGKNCFKDVKEEWYATYICYAKEQGWVNGHDDGNFLFRGTFWFFVR